MRIDLNKTEFRINNNELNNFINLYKTLKPQVLFLQVNDKGKYSIVKPIFLEEW